MGDRDAMSDSCNQTLQGGEHESNERSQGKGPTLHSLC